MSTISASTTSTTAFKITTDTTGALVFQTGASPTTAMTLGSDQSVTFAGTPTYTGGTANGVAYLNGSKVLTTGTALVFDGSNLGVGVTPSAWGSRKALEVGNAGSALFSVGANQNYLTSNSYFDGAFKYGATGTATAYQQYAGTHAWLNAASGSAGGTITFTQAMTLDASGNLGVGATPSAWGSSWKALEFSGGSAAYSNGTQMSLGSNAYQDNVGWKYKTNAGASVYSNVQGIHYWFNAPSGTAGSAITFTQAMTLDASGSLGVGVTPSAWSLSGSTALQVRYASILGYINNAYIQSNAYYSSPSWKYINNDYAQQYEQSGGAHSWKIAPSGTAGNAISFTQAMTLDSSGNFFVGKSTTSTFGVGSYLTPNGGWFCSGTSGTNFYHVYDSATANVKFYVTGTGTINAVSTTITGISDQRLKENIRDLDDGLEKVMALQPRKFDWKEGKGAGTKDARGFIAQEFETVFPDLVEQWLDEAPEGEDPYKSVRADLIPTLVKAIQEQQAIIEQLRADVAALKGTV